MAIYLSIPQVEDVMRELQSGGYPADTPVAVVYRASWEDEKIVRGTLEDIAARVKSAGITKQALILVGEALEPKGKEQRSKLYDKSFSHEYRRGEK